MAALSDHVKEELKHALKDENAAMFQIDGEIISIEKEDLDSDFEDVSDLSTKIKNYPELKESLNRYLNHPEMRRYTAKELKGKRNARRK
ncbi:hypothetical protein [Scopulibacillus cellulosilyticus]|uniref:Uncharacterized protein n=1 Tax=Scopulibacillus cellulosilyticus TaxID=2665665 RepID=A0ABW2Q3E6_9BACL